MPAYRSLLKIFATSNDTEFKVAHSAAFGHPHNKTINNRIYPDLLGTNSGDQYFVVSETVLHISRGARTGTPVGSIALHFEDAAVNRNLKPQSPRDEPGRPFRLPAEGSPGDVLPQSVSAIGGSDQELTMFIRSSYLPVLLEYPRLRPRRHLL